MSGPGINPGFSTPELTEIFSARATVSAMLEFESALALALAETGIAPIEEAEQVASACRAGVADPDAILASTWDAGTPLIALREAVITGIDENARQWFHFGATSQDAIDTGATIQATHGLDALDGRLRAVARSLRDLTLEHRGQPQMGRTFLQDARPTTFGFRTTTWLDAVLTHIEDLRRQRSQLVVQLGGPVGTLSAYGDKGAKVISSVAATLGLGEPDVAWHSQRTRVVGLAQAVERAGLTMGAIGGDLALLASSAIAEVVVRSGGSSSMPEKENPLDAIRAVAAARACAGAVEMLTSVSVGALDREIGGWHVEWLAVPLAFQTAGAAIESIETCLRSLVVNRATMNANAGADASEVPPEQIDRVLAAYDRLLG